MGSVNPSFKTSNRSGFQVCISILLFSENAAAADDDDDDDDSVVVVVIVVDVTSTSVPSLLLLLLFLLVEKPITLVLAERKVRLAWRPTPKESQETTATRRRNRVPIEATRVEC